MKKLMSLLLIASVSVFVLGCGEEKKAADKDKGKTPAKAPDTTPKEGKEK